MAAFAYPPVLNPLEHARDFLPPVLRTEPHFAFVQALLFPFARVDAEQAGYVAGLAYPDTATGEALAALGSWVGEATGGLLEWEYRRIVLGGIAARAARRYWTDATALAVVVALTRDEDATVGTLSAGWVTWSAVLQFTPSTEWLARAEIVVRKAIRIGLNFEVVLSPSGVMRWNLDPGWNTGLWATVLSSPPDS